MTFRVLIYSPSDSQLRLIVFRRRLRNSGFAPLNFFFKLFVQVSRLESPDAYANQNNVMEEDIKATITPREVVHPHKANTFDPQQRSILIDPPLLRSKFKHVEAVRALLSRHYNWHCCHPAARCFWLLLSYNSFLSMLSKMPTAAKSNRWVK